MSLPVNLLIEKNKINAQYPWLLLVKFALYEGESNELIYRFVKNFPDITFQGEEYKGFNFDISFIEQSTEGKIPTTSIAVCNVTQYLQGTLEDYEGAVDGKITLTIVHADSLDEDYSELELEFDIVKTSLDGGAIEFELGAPSALRRRFPLHRHLPDKCPYEFGSARCGYTGGDSVCYKRYSDCREKENQVRFGGEVMLPESM